MTGGGGVRGGGGGGGGGGFIGGRDDIGIGTGGHVGQGV